MVLRETTPHHEGDALVAHVVLLDGFGNFELDAGHADLAALGLRLGRRVELEAGGRRQERVVVARTFADVPRGALLLYEDPAGALAVAVNGGDAGAVLGVVPGDEVRIRPA